jgi:hypothetical protein
MQQGKRETERDIEIKRTRFGQSENQKTTSMSGGRVPPSMTVEMYLLQRVNV